MLQDAMTEHLKGYSGADLHNLLTVSDQLILRRLHAEAIFYLSQEKGDTFHRTDNWCSGHEPYIGVRLYSTQKDPIFVTLLQPTMIDLQ